MNKVLLVSLFLFALVASCTTHEVTSRVDEEEIVENNGAESTALFSQVTSGHSGVDFVNRSIETVTRNIADYDYFYNGAGVAIGDLNNDDLPDLFFAGNDVPNKMYFNQGNMQFKDVTAKAGISGNKWSTGVSMVDVNGDGWLDVYVCNSGPDADSLSTENEMWINQQDGTFVDESVAMGINDPALSTQAVFFDMDNDGDQDLWVLNHSERGLGNQSYEWLGAMKALPFEKQRLLSNTIYENQGNGKYKDVTTRSGLRNPGFGLGISVSDFNHDGLLDVYIANDFFIPDLFYINEGQGKFKEVSKEKLKHISFFSMGCDAADINNDGLSDLYVLDMASRDHVRSKTNMNSMSIPEFRFLKNDLGYIGQYMTNMLQLNRGDGQMSEIGHLAGVDRTDWSWAPLIADFDNDGWKDIYVTNGMKRDIKNNDWRTELLGMLRDPDYDRAMYFEHLQKAPTTPLSNVMFQNNGDLTFGDKSAEWGLTLPSFSNGAAYGDLDLDGDLDLVVNNLDIEASIWQNNTQGKAGGNYLQLQLEGRQAMTNGAEVRIYTSSGIQMCENQFIRGYASSVDPIIHFGLGADTMVSIVQIVWRDGTMSELRNVKANQRLTQHPSELYEVPVDTVSYTAMFVDESHSILGKNVYHHENAWDDFEKEILLPHEMTRMGPGVAVGDVNGDGLQDFFLGAGTTNPSRLFIQKDGAFSAVQGDFKANRNAEIIDACFFDVDKDGDLDLYAASGGGGEFVDREEGLQDVLYLNDGHGHFSVAADFPVSLKSSGAVQPIDVDNDGWIDIFVGTRNVPGKYGASESSVFLKNEGGQLVDRTEEYLGGIADFGMVTDVLAEDLNADGLQDLIIVGDWMNITVLINRRSSFDLVEHQALRNMEGWWRSIHKVDLDQDGDMDFILGNIGENNKFHPSANHPLHLFAGDFDASSTWDIVLSKEYKDKLVPVRGKECSTAQMPFVAYKYPTYDQFASSSVYDILGKNVLDTSVHRVAHTFSHVVIENLGEFKFKVHEMPRQAQMAPLYGLTSGDWDGDGKVDLLLAGNETGTEVETVPYDAGKGLILFNNSLMSVGAKPEMNLHRMGLAFDGNVKSMDWITVDGESKLLVVENAGPVKIVSVR
jgi:enediyne biosynthesis protein E4